ncbi:uncharacterized protein LOC114310604 [Camellia sinensis]|uniref:uncharacterized protein LOC114310604 n=1 Tax=Camellia sinensis TaxID=4442 RepID=UPI001036772D|nr:uncharacterized protein LOC114310604 [Camellia sinensis]
MLLDIGASHSFIESAFASILGLESEQLESPLMVESPVEDMSGFDIILGMDWLSSYCAIINYYCRRVTVCTLGGDCFSFLGDRIDRLLLSWYDPRTRGKLSSLLATFLVDGNSRIQSVFPRVVYEYFDVFPEDLAELPPYREVKFSIDLVPNTAPISMSPYRFVPTELLILKEKLQ